MQEESSLERIAQRSLASLTGNRIYWQPVPCHANSYNHESIPLWELIVKSSSNIILLDNS
jgi:hypothetical protein